MVTGPGGPPSGSRYCWPLGQLCSAPPRRRHYRAVPIRTSTPRFILLISYCPSSILARRAPSARSAPCSGSPTRSWQQDGYSLPLSPPVLPACSAVPEVDILLVCKVTIQRPRCDSKSNDQRVLICRCEVMV